MGSTNDNSKKHLFVGKDSVVIGNVSGNIGDGSVVIGATDPNGNTILNKSMAIGRNAYAAQDSIAIGAGAGAGSGIEMVLNQIGKIIQNTDDPELLDSFTAFCAELNKPNKNKTLLTTLWNGIKSAAALNGFTALTAKISEWIA